MFRIFSFEFISLPLEIHSLATGAHLISLPLNIHRTAHMTYNCGPPTCRRDALWYICEANGVPPEVAFVDLRDPSILHNLRFAGFHFLQIDGNTAVFGSVTDSLHYLFYSLDEGYGAVTALPVEPCNLTLRSVCAHAYAFFFQVEICALPSVTEHVQASSTIDYYALIAAWQAPSTSLPQVPQSFDFVKARVLLSESNESAPMNSPWSAPLGSYINAISPILFVYDRSGRPKRYGL